MDRPVPGRNPPASLSRRHHRSHLPNIFSQSPLSASCQNGAFFAVLAAMTIAVLCPVIPEGLPLALLLVAAALWVARLLFSRQVPVVFSLAGAPILVATTYGLIRYGLSPVEAVARQEWLLGSSAALAFFVILNNLRHRWQVTVLTWVLAGIGLGVALGGLWQMLWGGAPDVRVAIYLELIFPVLAANALFSRRPYSARLALLLIGLVTAGAAYLAFDYGAWGGWIGALLVLTVYVIRRRTPRRRWILVGGVTLTAVLLGIFVVDRALRQENFWPRQELAATRLAGWRSAVDIGRQHLWTGGGPGMFRWLYPAHRRTQDQLEFAGNEYLQTFANYGIAGLVLGMWCAVTFGIEVFQILALRGQRYSSSTPSNRYALAVGGLAAFAGLLLVALWNTVSHLPGYLLTAAVIAGATLTSGVKHRGEDPDDNGPLGTYNAFEMKGLAKWAVSGTLTVVILLLGSLMVKTYPAAVFRQQGDRHRAALQWAEAEKSYRRAWAFDALHYETAAALGDLHAARAAWATDQTQELARHAVTWYDRALTRNPYAADLHIKLGRMFDLLGQRATAAAHYHRALQADPRNAAYLAQLGLHELRWGNQPGALAHFQAAYELRGPDLLPERMLQHFDQFAP